MNQRRLGGEGLTASEIGLGCMGMSEFYGTTDEGESISTIHRAIELGVTFIDTTDSIRAVLQREAICAVSSPRLAKRLALC